MRSAVKTVFIGAGQGSREVLELVEQGRLAFLGIEVLGVVDVDPDAPGLRFAAERGWPTFGRVEEGLGLPGLELVIELTGLDRVLDQVHHHVPPGVRVIDHVMARVFWDLEKVSRSLREELEEKTRLEARVARDRAELQEILDTIPDMLVVLDREGRVDRVNRRFQEVTGKSLEEVHGLIWEELFPTAGSGASSAAFISPFATVLQTGNPVTVVYSDEGPGAGTERHFQITANPIYGEGGQIGRVVQTSREITEQVRLKRETEESARRFTQIVDAVRAVIAIKDLNGRYQLVNPRAEQVFGIGRDRMIGRGDAELFSEEVCAILQANDRRALAEGGNFSAEELLSISGRERYLVSERFPLTDYRGRVVGLCYVATDQSRRRQLQRELIQTERLAAIGKLAAGVAHEINNPLSGILTFAQDLLLEAAPDDPARQDYELIVNETLRCRRIVRDLLEYSRQKSPQRRRVTIAELVSRVLPLVERQASFHNVDFEVVIAEDLPEVDADPQQMQQVLLNLVINARDAMQASGVIRIGGMAADAGRAVALTVSDSGCGIPAHQLEQIFEPFFSTKGEQGHGLGLTAVRNVVERHGGRMEVESEVGRGSTFRVVLPAAWD